MNFTLNTVEKLTLRGLARHPNGVLEINISPVSVDILTRLYDLGLADRVQDERGIFWITTSDGAGLAQTL